MWDADTGMIDKFHKYCQKQSRDSFHMLDEKLIFSNDAARKEDYASKRLPYPLEAGDYSSWDKLLSTLYSEEERRKIEWAIGSIITGDSKTIQKFVVLYGAAGTGKSTVLNIIQMLFDGYYSVFDSKALGSATNVFALEAFRSNPLVAIEHDGDLSRIEDNTKINSLVSHEQMTVNEKFKSTYTNSFKCFLIMGTNKPVRITDGKSGLLRRLIDVSPSGDKLSQKEYKEAMAKVKFELGAIAWHCKEVYLENPGRYDDYVPVAMLGASNDFYNFILSAYHVFKKHDSTTLKEAWEIIQLPYIIKTEQKRKEANQRRQEIEDQLSGSKYGIAYADGTEKITQLNRSLENNLLKQIETLQEQLYAQLGITQSILDGTADEKTMLNYNSRTIEPIASAIADEFKRKFLTKTAITQGQSITYFKDPFKLVPVSNIAEIADKFTRNEIMTSNEIRQIIGMMPSPDPKADQLINSNIAQPNESTPQDYTDKTTQEGENQNG